MKEAKKSVFMKTVKLLHELNLIDDSLNMRQLEIEKVDFKSLFPHYKEEEKIDKTLPQPGTRNRKQIYNINVVIIFIFVPISNFFFLKKKNFIFRASNVCPIVFPFQE